MWRQGCIPCDSTYSQIFVSSARNGHKPDRGRGVEPHDNQRPFPRSLIPGLLHDGVVDLSFSILGIDHVKMATVISHDPDFATSNAFPSAKERAEAFQRRVFSRVVQTGHNGDGQFLDADAVGIKVESVLYRPH